MNRTTACTTDRSAANRFAAALCLCMFTASGCGGSIGYWKFDEGSGVTAIDSAGANPGAIKGNVAYTGGGLNSAPIADNADALHFSESPLVSHQNVVLVKSSASLEVQAFRVSAWVRNKGAPSMFSYILNKNLQTGRGSYALYTHDSGGLMFYVTAVDTSSGNMRLRKSPDAGTSVWDGNWHLVEGRVDRTGVHLCVDGRDFGAGDQLSATERVAYGADLGANSLYFRGDLTIGNFGTEPFPHNYHPEYFRWRGDIDEVQIAHVVSGHVCSRPKANH